MSNSPQLENPKVSNTLIWIQALMPVIGAFFAFGTVVCIVINIILLTFDEKELKKAGYDVAQLGGVWLVPAYLYKRAKMLKENNAYFIVWCVTFGLSFLGFF